MATTTTTTTTTNERDSGLKERSQPLTVSIGDILRAAMQKKADGRGECNSSEALNK